MYPCSMTPFHIWFDKDSWLSLSNQIWNYISTNIKIIYEFRMYLYYKISKIQLENYENMKTFIN